MMTTRIEPVVSDRASPEQREALASLKKAFGKVPALYATFAHSPGVLTALLQLQGAIGKGSLKARERHLIDLHVSQLNGCGYCLSAHATLARMDGIEDVEALRAGEVTAPRERALVDLARRLVRTGGPQAGAEIAAAREAGLTDAEIVEAVTAVGVRSLFNALAIAAGTPIDWPKVPRIPEP
jgi:uncharacterized peroxidase-related enzyme